MAKRRKSKVSATKKAPRKKANAKVEQIKSHPLYGLKDYELVEYTPVDTAGNEGEKEIHIILPSAYEKSDSLKTTYMTLNVTDTNKPRVDLLFIQEKSADRVEEVSGKYEVKMSLHLKSMKTKLTKKRAKK